MSELDMTEDTSIGGTEASSDAAALNLPDSLDGISPNAALGDLKTYVPQFYLRINRIGGMEVGLTNDTSSEKSFAAMISMLQAVLDKNYSQLARYTREFQNTIELLQTMHSEFSDLFAGEFFLKAGIIYSAKEDEPNVRPNGSKVFHVTSEYLERICRQFINGTELGRFKGALEVYIEKQYEEQLKGSLISKSTAAMLIVHTFVRNRSGHLTTEM